VETLTRNTTEYIAVSDILSVSNRKHGGHGDIDVLAESIRELGLIEPLVVMRQDGEQPYRIVAGRRRFEAVRKLGWDSVPAVVLPEDTAAETEEEIALAENINRLDTHPLDEAATFRRLFDAGKSIEEIARYYSRSVSGIYHRIRLNGLIDEIKGMFRSGRLNITGASVLACLTPERQKAFCETVTDGDEVSPYKVKEFIIGVQNERYLRMINSERCAECGNRTRYKDAALFEEYARYDDVCFVPDCFRGRMKERLADKVRLAREDGDSAEIGRIALAADTFRFFDEYDRSIEIDGVSYTVHNDDDLISASSVEYEGYGFRAWYIRVAYDDVVAYPRFYIDAEGIDRCKADRAAAAEKGERAAADDDTDAEDDDDAEDTDNDDDDDTEDTDDDADTDDDDDDDTDDDDADAERDGAKEDEAGFLYAGLYDGAGIPEEERDAADTALYRKYNGDCYNFSRAFKERVCEKIIRRNTDNDDPERRRRVIRRWLEREFDDMYDRAVHDWQDRFELHAGIHFDDNEDVIWDILSDMPAGKLLESVHAARFDPAEDLPGPEIMNDDYVPSEADNYEQSPVGAFAGGSFDRLRDVYRETFKELAEEAVEEPGKE
jgi:ParB/RepB/Spo0J family partition protein